MKYTVPEATRSFRVTEFACYFPKFMLDGEYIRRIHLMRGSIIDGIDVRVVLYYNTIQYILLCVNKCYT